MDEMHSIQVICPIYPQKRYTVQCEGVDVKIANNVYVHSGPKSLRKLWVSTPCLASRCATFLRLMFSFERAYLSEE